ncbi:MAG: hypothetical protein ACRC0F_00815 [Cetobacterium sp.]
MSYIWKVDTSKNYKLDDNPIPGIEVHNFKNNIIKVNYIVRFQKLISNLLEIETTIENKNEIIDIVFHMLAEMDRKSFVNKHVIKREYVLKDIKNGIYGDLIRKKIDIFEERELEILLNGILKSFKKIDLFQLFQNIVKNIFQNASKLYYFESSKVFCIYLGVENEEINRIKIKIIKELFWDITEDIDIYYDLHFGIMGTDETMIIDNIIMG